MTSDSFLRHFRPPKHYRITSIALILGVVVLLPAVFYSAYELQSLSSNEALIADIYARQMDAILFSLNQHVADVASSWASGIVAIQGSPSPGAPSGALLEFLSARPGIEAVIVADSALSRAEIAAGPRGSPWSDRGRDVLRALGAVRDTLARLWQVSRLEYRKIEPVRLSGGARPEPDAALLFVVRDDRGARIVGMVLDEETFVRTTVLNKAQEIAGEEFVLAISREGLSAPVASTGPVRPDELRHIARLWMLPGFSVGIRLQGETVEEILQRRFTGNLILILVMSLFLVGGAYWAFRAMKREMELAQLKSDFVSNVSHELRTPLALIRMYAETLEMGRLTDAERQRQYHSTILQEAERLSRLVNNVLNFARIEAGRKQYSFAAVDLNAVVADVLRVYSHQLENEGFSPVVELAGDLPPVNADREAVTEALINILDNAMKFSGPEKFIRVSTAREGGGVSVEVQDRGIGISPAHQKKIFETFYRVPGAAPPGTKGSGIGLALVKQIMDAHGGAVTVQSQPGVGSTFRMSFPEPASGSGAERS